MSFIVPLVTVASGLMSAVGAIQQGQAAAAAANYQAQVAANNAKMAQDNAAYERQRGAVEQQTQDMKTRAMLASQEAQQGASGFDLNTGTLLDLRESSARLGRMDSLTTRNNTERRAREFDIAATNAQASSQLYSQQAKSSLTAGYLGGFSSLLSTASSVGSKWDSWKTAGYV